MKLLALAMILGATPAPPGPHAFHQAYFEQHPPLTAPLLPRAWTGGTAQLTRRVYGYLPSYNGISVSQLRWDALTDVVLFSASVSSSSGAITVPALWSQANVDAAHQNGGRAHLCATLFSGIHTFLSNATATQAAISQLVSAVQAKGGDGVNIDFEFVASGDKAAFVQFITDLATALHQAIPGSEVTLAMPAYPPWDPGYDVPNLASAADRLLLMEYDWHWAGGPTAGPVAPLTSGGVWGTTVSDGMSSYLAQAPAGKLAMGVPYYGYDWPTASETSLGASTQGSAAAVTYKNCANDAASHGGSIWDTASQTPWYHYTASSQAHQAWYEDAQSLSAKYDLVNSENLAGIMIWALGYEGTDTAPGDLIISKFGVVAPADAGSPIADAGSPIADAGSPIADAGASIRDAGPPPTDAGAVMVTAVEPTHAGLGAPLVTGGCGSTGSGLGLLGLLALALRRRR